MEEAHSAAAPWDATRAVALTSVEGWTAADDFPRFARATLDSAASCSGRVALTWVGKARLDLASKLTLFRLAVYGQKWTDAKHLADELRQVNASLIIITLPYQTFTLPYPTLPYAAGSTPVGPRARFLLALPGAVDRLSIPGVRPLLLLSARHRW